MISPLPEISQVYRLLCRKKSIGRYIKIIALQETITFAAKRSRFTDYSRKPKYFCNNIFEKHPLGGDQKRWNKYFHDCCNMPGHTKQICYKLFDILTIISNMIKTKRMHLFMLKNLLNQLVHLTITMLHPHNSISCLCTF